MSLKEEDCSDNLDGVTEKQLNVLQEWEAKFKVKYSIVGTVGFLCFTLLPSLIRQRDASSLMICKRIGPQPFSFLCLIDSRWGGMHLQMAIKKFQAA